MTLNSSFVLRAALIPFYSIAAASSLSAATLLTNGDFENWTNSTTPAGWTKSGGVTAGQVTGLDGTGSAALLGLTAGGSTSSGLGQTVPAIGPSSAFSVTMDFSQSALSGRGMNLNLRQSAGTTVLNFAVIDGYLNTTAGTVFGNVAGSYQISINTAYRLEVAGTLGVGGRYSVNLYELSNLTTPVLSLSDQNRWQTTPDATTTLSIVSLETGRIAAGMTWTADNVGLIPEPTAALLLGLGAVGFAARRRR